MTSQSSSIHENFVFSSLSLYNFKMHRNTQLNLSEVPITIISGANGSGKTQLLEALILAMKREKSAFKLYTDLSNLVKDQDIKELFRSLAQEELKHKLRFELEYDDNILGEN